MSSYYSGSVSQLDLSKLAMLLPDQGCIELQQDKPCHTHDWHQHDINETLIIIKGRIIFSIGDDVITCGPGEYVMLPAGTRHKSTSSEFGCIYAICFQDVRKALYQEMREQNHD
ncbi:cupin domain-containing protein [Halomonas campisalis]|uniref:Cupin domain-containing protein n=1 Tax=Billgrantia campisalis TaxID=74661 RepID=A0ABS9P6Y5_9GAMM|nr:cupin domain-containing protein [Halomonas campisalis]MCG6657542.1 cupin domain-containing protein [Halomonas campisalis]MDR5862686.1 cupin domain-containing protein [Halomonas campisalis]